MASWEFKALGADDYSSEVTQRDQFNNEDVSSTEALVREAIQNSFDARLDDSKPVKVRFAIVDLSGTFASRLKEHIGPLQVHLQASLLPTEPLQRDTAKVVVIEDFNTSGLLGAIDQRDDKNFDYFWRGQGNSSKQGKAGGRWGLGKLVYSSASEVRAFFGSTIRSEGSAGPFLMGLAVLKNHRIGSTKYIPQGYWFEGRGLGAIQLPITDNASIAEFSDLVQFQRTDEPGLSIAVPFARGGLSEEVILNVVVRNYYMLVKSGELEVEVGDRVLRYGTILSVAGALSDQNFPLTFVDAVETARRSHAGVTVRCSVSEKGLAEDCLNDEQLAGLRIRYQAGQMIRLDVCFNLSRKAEERSETRISLFLQKPAEPVTKGFSIFVRGSMTVPGQHKDFDSCRAWGAMVATDPLVVDFLGDAENPAHSSWEVRAEKLSENWKNPTNSLYFVRYSLKTFYQLVAHENQREDWDALTDFFSLADESDAKGNKKRQTASKVPLILSRNKSIYSVQKRADGFSIVPGEGAATLAAPVKIRVEAAYDIIGANPFKKYSPFDFEFEKDVAFTPINCEISRRTGNVMDMLVTSGDFRLDVSGFDRNRDLIVNARQVRT